MDSLLLKSSFDDDGDGSGIGVGSGDGSGSGNGSGRYSWRNDRADGYVDGDGSGSGNKSGGRGYEDGSGWGGYGAEARADVEIMIIDQNKDCLPLLLGAIVTAEGRKYLETKFLR